jgi:hypothetical protein
MFGSSWGSGRQESGLSLPTPRTESLKKIFALVFFIDMNFDCINPQNLFAKTYPIDITIENTLTAENASKNPSSISTVEIKTLRIQVFD